MADVDETDVLDVVGINKFYILRVDIPVTAREKFPEQELTDEDNAVLEYRVDYWYSHSAEFLLKFMFNEWVWLDVCTSQLLEVSFSKLDDGFYASTKTERIISSVDILTIISLSGNQSFDHIDFDLASQHISALEKLKKVGDAKVYDIIDDAYEFFFCPTDCILYYFDSKKEDKKCQYCQSTLTKIKDSHYVDEVTADD